jgi:hypothetical protein
MWNRGACISGGFEEIGGESVVLEQRLRFDVLGFGRREFERFPDRFGPCLGRLDWWQFENRFSGTDHRGGAWTGHR